MFAFFGVVFQLLASFTSVNILKPIILFGTFSLALAFAANDLVNFIGVPLAGFQSYSTAFQSADPLNISMSALSGKVPTNNLILFTCGVVMVLALWFSRKARTVTDTEVSLSSHEEDNEKFESIALSRAIVRIMAAIFDVGRLLIPRSFRKYSRRKFDRSLQEKTSDREDMPSFDFLRASTNLMVASIVVSFATSLKLPLSTTYVTFMVAMGTSFADQAWGRETAVYRVTGVLTVIGGWFMTAIMASTIAGVFCAIIYFTQAWGVLALLAFASFMLWNTHHTHKERQEDIKRDKIFNLRKIEDAANSISISFEHSAFFVATIRENLSGALKNLFIADRAELKKHFRVRKQIRIWSNIIAANVFKSMRLLHKKQISEEFEYYRTISCLQNLAASYRDIVRRSYSHVSEHHKRFLTVQIKEIQDIEAMIIPILQQVEKNLNGQQGIKLQDLLNEYATVVSKVEEYAVLQNERIHNRSSKTRLSILYFALMENMLRITSQCLKLQEIFEKSLGSESVKEQLKVVP